MAVLLRNALNKQSGLVLAYVLLLTQSLMLIVMFCLFRAISLTKVLNDGVRQQVLSERVWQMFSHIPVSGESPCRIPVLAWTLISNKSLNWWQENGCERQENGVHYYHVIEALGIDHCASIGANPQSQWVAEYYRLTLYAVAEGLRYQPIQLQATYAIPVLTTEQCPGVMHSVTHGLQSLREW